MGIITDKHVTAEDVINACTILNQKYQLVFDKPNTDSVFFHVICDSKNTKHDHDYHQILFIPSLDMIVAMNIDTHINLQCVVFDTTKLEINEMDTFSIKYNIGTASEPQWIQIQYPFTAERYGVPFIIAAIETIFYNKYGKLFYRSRN